MKKITIEFDDEDAERILLLLEKLLALIESQDEDEKDPT